MTSSHEQAVTRARQGGFARARDLLQQLHAVNLQDTAILYDYALCVSEMGDKTDAIVRFQHLRGLAPEHVNGRVALASRLRRLGGSPWPRARFNKPSKLILTTSTQCAHGGRSLPAQATMLTPNAC